MVTRSFALSLLLLSTFTLAACSKSKSEAPPAPLVVDMQQTSVQRTATLSPAAAQAKANLMGISTSAAITASSTAVVTEVTLKKSSLLDRSFLYGTSLQFSAIPEEDINVTLMAIVLGQIPVEFKIVDDKLRLVTDGKINFESDVNHPSRLVLEFPILKQDADTVTVRADKASPILDTFLLSNKNTVAKRATFIRSMEYVPENELFLIESTIELVDGSLAEFMETLTPRERQVTAGVQPIYNDPDLNPNAERFRFLDSGKVFIDKDGKRVPTLVANRFVLKDDQPIRWYVTRNAPEKYMGDIKNSIEAWNRYSRAMNRPDIIRFEGLLPEGVKVGDPRYNIIVWDNIQDAGAAYESQGADPTTGVQSNSLIYIPLAWINIGKQYWEAGGLSDAPGTARTAAMGNALKKRTFMGRDLPIHCMDDALLHVTAEAKQDPEHFARGLLKGVIFHEVGHSLGLAHNFKGSLSFDAEDNKKLFSTSIMDYNHYNEEEESFYNLDSADGPLLEYDRQIISVLYNDGKDVKESDAKLPACADEEADSFTGGVDPLCNRYDIGSDPTKQALRSLDLLSKTETRNGRMQSLPAALKSTLEGLGDPNEVKTIDDAKKAITKLTTVVKGTANLYVGGTANSLAYLSSQAVRSLYVFREDILPEGYVENEMRERAVTVLEAVLGSNSFPAATKDALAAVREGAAAFLQNTQAIAGLAEADRAKAIQDLLATLDKTNAATETALLSKLRTRMIGSIVYHAEAPVSFAPKNGATVDMEAEIVSLLENMAGAKAGSVDRPVAERLAAIKSLTSYASAGIGKDAVSRLRETINVEIRSSTDARKRADLRKLLAALPS